MATISSLGVGTNGLDTNSIVEKLLELEKMPLKTLELKATSIQSKISGLGEIKSAFSSLESAASRLASLTGWNGVTTTSSNSDAISATAIGGTVATSFNVRVSELAESQSFASAKIAKNAVVGQGTLALRLGKLDQATHTVAQADLTKSISLEISATDTLGDIASKINGAGAGVTATILSDSSGDRLLLRSTATGEANGFELTVDEGVNGNNTDDQGLSKLISGSGTPDGMKFTSYGRDAKATVNGLEVTSSSNTFENTVAGVTFKANKVTAQTDPDVTITVAKDNAKTIEHIQEFVKAYNTIESMLSEYTKYVKGASTADSTAGLFQGDSSITLLQTTLRNSIMAVSTASSKYSRLSDVGLSFERNANGVELTFDQSKFDKAMKENSAEVTALFRNTGTGSAQGVAVQLRETAKKMLGNDGYFDTKSKSLDDSVKRLDEEQERLQYRIDSVEKRLLRQYTALDTQMSSLNALSNYVSQQITTWNNSNKK